MRTPTRHIIHTLLPLTITTILAMLPAPALAANEAPVKESVASHIGWEANETTGGTLCTILSGDKCQPAKQSTEPGGFQSAPLHVAVNDDPASPNYHDIYVADIVAGRVTVLSPSGQLVSTFGSKGQAAGQFEEPRAITVDPASGNVYVSDLPIVAGERVWRLQEFTAEGVFLRKIGGSFTSENTLAFGPNDVLYVGEERRVQEFEADGKEKGEIPLPQTIPAVSGGHVNALAVDQGGNVYLTYGYTFSTRGGTVYKLNPAGQVLDEYGLSPRGLGATVEAQALALDPAGRLAVAEYEEKPGHIALAHRGVLYDTTSGHLRQITEFADVGDLAQGGSSGVQALVFNDQDEMFATVFSGEFPGTPAEYESDEVIAYTPVPVGEFVAGAAVCKPGTDNGSDATVDCALNGEMDPWEVADSEAWFKWGTTPGLGERTATQSVCTSGCGNTLLPLTPTVLKGLLPNETIYFQLDGEDANVEISEVLGSETVSFQTETVAPRIVGEPSASFIKAFSAVLSGAVNPENANTTYGFQYAPVSACEALEAQQAHPVSVEECPGMAEAQAGESSEYGSTATTVEASGLQPATGYRYRLYAKNAAGGAIDETGGATLPEGVFTTAPAPVPQVSTGAASMIGATSATLSGSVDADGQPAVYMLELGVYAGAATQYGIVLSATAGAGPVGIERPVSGLQPGTTYAYRVSVSSVYVPSEDHVLHGTPVTFTTLGVPAVLSVPSVLAQLLVPAIAIPKETGASKPKATSKTKKIKAKGKRKAHKRKTSKSKALKGGK